MKNKIIQFIKKHELDCFAPLLFVLLIVGVPGLLLVHHNQKLRKETNQNPSEYLVSIYIKNDKPTTSISVIDKEGRKFSYNNKKEGEIVDRIQSIVENNLPLLKQKQIPDSFPETIPEWKGKSVTIKVKWKNTKKVYRTVPVVTGDVILSNVYDDEETVDEGQFEKTFSNLK